MRLRERACASLPSRASTTSKSAASNQRAYDSRKSSESSTMRMRGLMGRILRKRAPGRKEVKVRHRAILTGEFCQYDVLLPRARGGDGRLARLPSGRGWRGDLVVGRVGLALETLLHQREVRVRMPEEVALDGDE